MRRTIASGAARAKATRARHPVVGQHHGADEQHQRAVEQPRHPAPLEELGERLDVARHPGDECATALLVVIGEAEPVDVADQPPAQVEQGLLAARAEAHDRLALGDPRDDQRDGGDDAENADETDAHALVADDAAVDRLLQQDRHDDPPDGADDGQQPRDAESLAQDRRLLEAAADRVHRREARRRRREAATRLDDHVSHRRPPRR